MSRHHPSLSLLALALLSACAGARDWATNAFSGVSSERSVTAGAAASEPSDCAAPLPGHPTTAERRAFVDEVSKLGVEAEQRHGVPAAAIAAMAIQESGYGWTRMARNTNDLPAWKYTTAEAAGGRDAWAFDCPGSPPDKFIVFRDRDDAVEFVAEQLATSDNYRADTDRYRRDRANGVAVAEAVDRWVDGIADPYSTQPDAYRQAIRRVMNDPYDPSDRRSPETNLYRLSEQVTPPRLSAQLVRR